ncbi:amidase [Rhizobium sp. FKL33]|uniref:amidase n=1 Tax=Rhizobium sp. FKL33 TaxID=2562307 RepID=UPI0010C10231|nr:amidase [Rhizobium sp. FKL33]
MTRRTQPLYGLTAMEALAALAAGEITSRDLVAACLERISTRDGSVRAWLAIHPRALDMAEDADAVPLSKRGRLHGLPIGVKDVFDTRDLPTTHNSPLFSGFQPAADAAPVDLLHAEGAIILGKTDTTEFAAAGRDAATGNPVDLTRTSGGSSAGSAAGVADGHVPLALATQTGGSTIRPASFCGVYAFKPSFGLVSREGVKIYANSLDTIGWHARSVEDLSLLAGVFGLTETIRPSKGSRDLSIAIARGPHAEKLDGDAQAALAAAEDRLREVGWDIRLLELPPSFAELDHHHRTILHREGAAAFRNLARRFGADLHDDFHHRVENRDGRSLADLRNAYDAAAVARIDFDLLASDFDAVIAPSAPGFAPLGRRPGDPVFNAIWTLLGVPALHAPLSGFALPIGVTLLGPRFSDPSLLAVAARIAPVLNAHKPLEFAWQIPH